MHAGISDDEGRGHLEAALECTQGEARAFVLRLDKPVLGVRGRADLPSASRPIHERTSRDAHRPSFFAVKDASAMSFVSILHCPNVQALRGQWMSHGGRAGPSPGLER